MWTRIVILIVLVVFIHFQATDAFLRLSPDDRQALLRDVVTIRGPNHTTSSVALTEVVVKSLSPAYYNDVFAHYVLNDAALIRFGWHDDVRQMLRVCALVHDYYHLQIWDRIEIEGNNVCLFRMTNVRGDGGPNDGGPNGGLNHGDIVFDVIAFQRRMTRDSPRSSGAWKMVSVVVAAGVVVGGLGMFWRN